MATTDVQSVLDDLVSRSEARTEFAASRDGYLARFNLSEGEKRRVDLAILYAFRQLCVMKASGGISLVVLDEMDSGLDFEGRAQFVDLVRDMSPNAWVISHAIRGSGLEPMFDKIVGVHKIGNFTVISED